MFALWFALIKWKTMSYLNSVQLKLCREKDVNIFRVLNDIILCHWWRQFVCVKLLVLWTQFYHCYLAWQMFLKLSTAYTSCLMLMYHEKNLSWTVCVELFVLVSSVISYCYLSLFAGSTVFHCCILLALKVEQLLSIFVKFQESVDSEPDTS